VTSSPCRGGSTRRSGSLSGPTSLTGLSVDGLPDQVGMAVVTGVLLDPLQHDQRRLNAPSCGLFLTDRGSSPSPARARSMAAPARATHSSKSARPSSGVSSLAVRHSQSGSASQSTSPNGGG